MRTPGLLVARLVLLCAALLVVVALVSWQQTEDGCAEAGATVVREIAGAVDRSVLPAALAKLTGDCRESSPLLAAAGALRNAGREPEAEPLARHVVREEPDNFAAWAILSLALAKNDPAASERARARALELNPLAGD
jgi:hypothetical protein